MTEKDRLKEILGSREKRMESLYKIVNKQGELVKFKKNKVQADFAKNLHYLNIILKSRQHGMSTFIELLIGDVCMFNSNISAGIIADTLDNAKKLLGKIRKAYENLPKPLIDANPLTVDSKTMLEWKNGSSIEVGTSMRSGTVQFLHISEFGKICAKTPDKAKEIVTGALEAVAAGQYVFIESTAEGEGGYFHDMSVAAQDKQKMGAELTPMDYKFFFYPWWKDVNNTMKHDTIVIDKLLLEYFLDLENKHDIHLTQEQKNWYAKKKETLKDNMTSEHPTTPDEAFKGSVEGAYYKTQFNKIMEEKRITRVPYDPALDVYTSWDLGVNDTTAIWFFQVHGSEMRVIDCYENSGEGLPFYILMLREKGYRYGTHYFPHDIKVRELGTGKSREDVLCNYGLTNYVVVDKLGVQEGIDAVRTMLGNTYFDESNTIEGVKALKGYRKQWDDKTSTFKNNPLHDWCSNYADSFRYFAVGYKKKTEVKTGLSIMKKFYT